MPDIQLDGTLVPQVKKLGAFDTGGNGWKVLGILGDALATAGGGRPSYLQSVLQQRDDQRQLQRSILLQQLENQQWQQRQEYERAHPAPFHTEANNGDVLQIDPTTGTATTLFHDPTPKTTWQAVDNGDDTKTLMPFVNGMPVQAQPSGGALPPGYSIRGGAAPQGAGIFPAALNAMIGQESGGRAGAVGPQTPYGRAIGMTQMLPSTAKGVAAKIGVPFRPDLLAGTSPEAATYQKALGAAYLQEGYNATGNWRDAFRYYHGGPSRSMWGPKTNAYADAVLARMGG